MNSEIADTLEFLELFAPNEIDQLRRDHPNAEVLKNGVVLGVADPGLQTRTIVIAISLMLTRVVDESQKAIAQTTAKLESARRLEVAGSVATALSGLGVVAASLRLHDDWVVACLGLVAAVASVLPAIVNWLRGSITSANTAAALLQVRDCVWEAQRLRGLISRDQSLGNELTVADANTLAKQAKAALFELGYETTVAPL